MIAAFSGEYRFLSNFWPCAILYEGIEYPSVEHAFQAAKSLDDSVRRMVAQAPSPGQAKRMGNRSHLRPGWTTLKVEVMRTLVHLKFEQPDLRIKLLSTHNDDLVEGNTWGDQYWGMCNGRGQNVLGVILMDERDAIRKANDFVIAEQPVYLIRSANA